MEIAINAAKTKTGKYSDNKEFIDQLVEDLLITQEEYVEINGEGIFNLEQDMVYVVKLLEGKLPKVEEPVEEPEDHYYLVNTLDSICKSYCKKVYLGKGDVEKDEYTFIYILDDQKINLEGLEEFGLVGLVLTDRPNKEINIGNEDALNAAREKYGDKTIVHLNCLDGESYTNLSSDKGILESQCDS